MIVCLNPKCMIPFLSPSGSRMAFALLTEVSSGPIHLWNSLRVLGGSRSEFPRWTSGVRLPELSNCYCHPGRAGGTPMTLASTFEAQFPQAREPTLFGLSA